MKNAFLLGIAACALTVPAAAQEPQYPVMESTIIAPPVMQGEIALPVSNQAKNREIWTTSEGKTWVRNVTHPTLTPVLPVGTHRDTAVIVAPGGGFLGLSMQNEAWDIARWLANNGIPAFILKYRTVPTPVDQAQFDREIIPAMSGGKASFGPPGDTPPEALSDGEAAIAYLKANAQTYGINPDRIGFMGFSAGGMLARSLATGNAAGDLAFAAPIYPMMNAVDVPANAPPIFVALAADDPLFGKAPHGLVDSWEKAGKPVEFHLFANGGHGFGAGEKGTAAEGWLKQFVRWLDATQPRVSSKD